MRKGQARKKICGCYFLHIQYCENVYMCVSVCMCHNAATQMFRILHLYVQRHVLVWDCCQVRKSLW